MNERRPPTNVIKFPMPEKAIGSHSKYLEIARKLIAENATPKATIDSPRRQEVRGNGNIQIVDDTVINQTAEGDNNIQVAAPLSRLLKQLTKVRALLEKKAATGTHKKNRI